MRCIPIRFDDDEDGIVMQMFDDEGNQTRHPIRAVAAIIEMISGPHAGTWRAIEVDFDRFETVSYH